MVADNTSQVQYYRSVIKDVITFSPLEDKFWVDYYNLNFCRNNPRINVHLGIFVQPYLDRIIGGSKTVESRWAMDTRPPYNRVKKNDLLLLKESGKAIKGIAVIDEVWYYKLNHSERLWNEIKERFESRLGVDKFFLGEMQYSNKEYVTFLALSHVARLGRYIPFTHKGQSGWVTIHIAENPNQQKLLI
jgi:hypothetical protein